MQYMLLTDNPEKIPDTGHCAAGDASPACSPGFFDASPDNILAPVGAPRPHACCEGYFCPAQLTCMVPCPTGSYCPRYAWFALSRGRSLLSADGSLQDVFQSCVASSTSHKPDLR